MGHTDTKTDLGMFLAGYFANVKKLLDKAEWQREDSSSHAISDNWSRRWERSAADWLIFSLILQLCSLLECRTCMRQQARHQPIDQWFETVQHACLIREFLVVKGLW
jgi:hypothetical protein